MTTTAQTDRLRAQVAGYATGYTNQARLLLRAAEAMDKAGVSDDAEMMYVETMLDKEIFEAARLRALAANVNLSIISCAELFRAAMAATPDPDFDPTTKRPPLREYSAKGAEPTRYRWRFSAPRQPYEAAKELIVASRQTVSTVVEAGLKDFALTGKIN